MISGVSEEVAIVDGGDGGQMVDLESRKGGKVRMRLETALNGNNYHIW